METSVMEESAHASEGRIEACIRDCLNCYQACLSCINHCLSMGEEHASSEHITAMMECSLICNTSASLMRLNSGLSHEVCQLCAKMCDVCEESCRSIGKSDQMMQRCADACARCAESCRSMSH